MCRGPPAAQDVPGGSSFRPCLTFSPGPRAPRRDAAHLAGPGRRAAARGHEIGNHTFTHVKLHRRGQARVRAELQQAHETIAEITGRAPRGFRAPHGYRNPFVSSGVRRLGCSVFGWTFGVWDSARPGAEVIRRRVARGLRPGAIILLHDGDGYDAEGARTQTAAALPGIIADARARGHAVRPLRGREGTRL